MARNKKEYEELYPAEKAHELTAKERVFLKIVEGHHARKDGTILVFSEFNAVLLRLLRVLRRRGIVKVALFTGDTPKKIRDGKFNLRFTNLTFCF